MAENKKRTRGKDTTGTKRQQGLRKLKTRIEAYLDPNASAEVAAMLAAGEASDKADLVRRALHEKYLRSMKATN